MASVLCPDLWICWILGLVLILTADTVQTDIEWNVQSSRVLQGEQVLATCSATDVGRFDAIKIQLQREGKRTVIVATNDDVAPRFENSGRYSASMQSHGDFVAVTLNISVARGEDTGHLICYTLQEQDKKATLQLTVDVPVQSLYFETQNETGAIIELGSGSTYAMKEGYNTGIMCVALMDGTTSPATMTMTLDNGEEVTDMFLGTSSPNLEEVKDNLEIASNRATLSYITEHPDSKFNGRELTCKATTVMGYQKEVKLYMDVLYAPIITCKLTEYFAQLEKPMEVVCRVISNPKATMSYLYENSASATEISEHPHADQFRFKEEPVSGDEMKVKINIHRVHTSHLTKYIIRAANDYGSKQTEFYIHQGAVDVDKEPTRMVPEPTPTEGRVEVVVKTHSPKEEEKEEIKKEGPREQPVLELEESQASIYGSASAVTVSMATCILSGLVQLLTVCLRR